jgi:hypothetical protein
MLQASHESAVAIKLYRTMQTDEAGRPPRGDGAYMLGVRVGVDAKPDTNGFVHPGRGGMSVTPDDPACLPPPLRPKVLDGGYGALPVFWIHRNDLGEDLSYRPDARKPLRHGLVEPATPVMVDAFQSALAATMERWQEWS